MFPSETKGQTAVSVFTAAVRGGASSFPPATTETIGGGGGRFEADPLGWRFRLRGRRNSGSSGSGTI